jgi:hypothetical protein
MAALNFPAQPFPNQLYPNPKIEGVTQYFWNASKGTWNTTSSGVQAITTALPATSSGSPNQPVIGVVEATTTQGGYMTAADKAKLDALNPNPVQKPPTYVNLDDISPLFNGVRVLFPMVENGLPLDITSPNELLVSLNGTALKPASSFNVIGSDILFNSAPQAGSTFTGVALV